MTMTVIPHDGGGQLASYAERVEYEIPSTLEEYRQIIRDKRKSRRTTYRYIKAIERAVSPLCRCGELECNHDAAGRIGGRCDGFQLERDGINLYDADQVRRHGLDLPPGPRAHFVSAVRPIFARARNRVQKSGMMTVEERQHWLMVLDAITGKDEGALADLRDTLKKANRRQGSGDSRSKLWLKPSQVERMRAKIDMGTRRGRRDAVLLGLLVACGLRRDEAAGVTWRSVVTRPANTGNGEADFNQLDIEKGKGDKPRSIPINSDLWQLLAAWREETGGGDDDPIVRSIGRLNAINDGITAGHVQNIVMKYGAAIGVPQLRPHDLRRTFGRICYQNGVDITLISHWLGHSSTATTRIYLGLNGNPDDIRTDFIRW